MSRLSCIGVMRNIRLLAILSILLSSTFGDCAHAAPAPLVQAQKAYDQALYGTILKLLEPTRETDFASSLLDAKTHEAYDSSSSNHYSRTGHLATRPTDKEMWEGYGMFNARRYMPAKARLENAIRLDPKNALAHAFYGCCLCHLDELSEGMAELKKAEALDPKLKDLNALIAAGYVGAGDSKQAEVYYNKYVAQNPNSARVYIMRADFYDLAGKYPAALADYDKAVQLSPGSQYAYYRRAHLLSEKKLYERVIPDAIKGSALEGVEEYGIKAQRLLSQAYEKTNQYHKAIEVWKPYLAHCFRQNRFSGADKLAIFSLIEDCEKVKDYKTAKTYVDLICSREPRSTEGLAKRARINMELNDLKNSLRDYNTLIAADPTNGQWFLDRARIFAKLGNVTQAEADSKKARLLAE